MTIPKLSSLKAKIILILSLFILIVTLTVGWVGFSFLSADIKENRKKEVGFVSTERHRALVDQLVAYQHSGFALITRLSDYCATKNTKENFDKTCVLTRLKAYREFEKASGIIFRWDKANINWISGSFSNPNIRSSDFAPGQLADFKSRKSGNYDQPFIIKAEDPDSGIQVFIEYPLEPIKQLFRAENQLGKSGEVFLAAKDGYFVTPPRYFCSQGISETISASPMKQCLKKNNKEMLDLDYRSMPVIHGFLYVPEIGGGCIMAHIDQAEAFAQLMELKDKMAGSAVAFLLLAFTLITLLAKHISDPLNYLAGLATTIAGGNYNPKSEIQRNDEIGVLSNAFNQMTASLIGAKRETEKASALNLGILDSSSDAIISINPAGMIESCNQASENLLGYKPEELLGQKVNLIIPEPERSKHDGYLQKYSATGEQTILSRGRELQVQKKDGSIFKIFLKVTEIQVGQEKKFIGVLRDLREIKRMESALQESENRFSLALSSIKDYAIEILDTAGVVTTWNAGAERIKGYKAAEIIGKGVRSFYTAEDVQAGRPELVLQSALSRGSHEEECIQVRKDGSRFLGSIIVTAIHDKHQRHIGFIEVVRDLTEKKSLEIARLEAEAANKQKTAFLASMSHEIRTPLNAIIGITEILLDTSKDEEQSSLIKVAHAAGENLLHIISDTLDLSRIESGAISLECIRFSLSEQIKTCIAIVGIRANERGIHLAWKMEPDLPHLVWGDSTRLRQILLNLLSNAIKFSDAGTVSLLLKKNPENAKELLFSVTDQGVGIPANKKELIFENFQQADESITRKFGGSGMGLAICKKLVTLFHGKIWVESVVGRGSTFYFTVNLPERFLPAGASKNDPDEVRSKLPAEVGAKDQSRSLRILLVDDSPDNLLIVQALLKRQPHYCHTVVVAENGQEAVDKFKQEHFDLVLMDVQMPVLDGYSATRKIRAWDKENHKKKCKIVAFTANAFVEDILASQQAGCDDHLNKPLKRERLYDLVDKCVVINQNGNC